MATTTVVYSSNTAITMDLSGLASSSSFFSGRESTEIDNTGSTSKFLDAIVRGSFIVGTTPATTGGLKVFVWGSDTSLTTAALDVLDGADSTETFTATSLGATVMPASFTPVLVATSDIKYHVKSFSVARMLGLQVLPKYWGIFVAHNMTAALKTDAGNTDSFSFVGIKYDIA